jgi:hypothetical protein
VLHFASELRDGDADHALTATFRYFVGFHSRASRVGNYLVTYASTGFGRFFHAGRRDTR